MLRKFSVVTALTFGCTSLPPHRETRVLDVIQVQSSESVNGFEYIYCEDSTTRRCRNENTREPWVEESRLNTPAVQAPIEPELPERNQPIETVMEEPKKPKFLAEITHRPKVDTITREQANEIRQAVSDVTDTMRLSLITYVHNKTPNGGRESGIRRMQNLLKVLSENGINQAAITGEIRAVDAKDNLNNKTVISVIN